MTVYGISFEGRPYFEKIEVGENQYVPDASMEELSERHQESLRKQIELAQVVEAVGYDYVVHSEHHANPLASVTPNPLVTQTAIAQETETVRLLQMANLLPLHDPVRLAEQVAMLDVLSEGRVDVGICWGGNDNAYETLSQHWGGTQGNSVKRFQLFEERYEILKRLWTEDMTQYDGVFDQIPAPYTTHDNQREYTYFAEYSSEYAVDDYLDIVSGEPVLRSLSVLPKPIQKPHPPLWKPTLSAESAAWAAREGVNICTHLFDKTSASELIDAYYDAAREATWPDRRDEYDGDSFQRGWCPQSERGVGIILQVFDTDVANEATIRRWKRDLEHALVNKKIRDRTNERESIEALIENEEGLFVGGHDTLVRELTAVVDELELEDAFFIFDPNTSALTWEEREDQLRALAEHVIPELTSHLN